jgi:hypothetical protein
MQNTVRQYLIGLGPMAERVGQMVNLAHPPTYDDMRQVYDLAKGSANFRALHLCLALIWQAYTLSHFDSKDYAYCATVCAGNFDGGHMIFSQFRLVLSECVIS